MKYTFFISTEEAINHDISNPIEVERLTNQYKEIEDILVGLDKLAEKFKNPVKVLKTLNAMSYLATQKQFTREAIEGDICLKNS